ncbi:MAG TPA: hypothetical protein VHZ28_07395 [Terracidiphilus sp.]|jgi:hypothetical protein|nr:hypothetical protein [Terracidiphilus sp.]
MIPRALPLVLVVALTCSFEASAQDKGYWTPASSTANAITGDLALYKDRITINFLSFPIVKAKDLAPAEVASVFDADVNAGVAGVLYHLNIPAAQRFLHKNTLCGSENAQWMATYATGRTLQVAFFSGTNTPAFTFEAVRNSPDLCGTFTYGR